MKPRPSFTGSLYDLVAGMTKRRDDTKSEEKVKGGEKTGSVKKTVTAIDPLKADEEDDNLGDSSTQSMSDSSKADTTVVDPSEHDESLSDFSIHSRRKSRRSGRIESRRRRRSRCRSLSNGQKTITTIAPLLTDEGENLEDSFSSCRSRVSRHGSSRSISLSGHGSSRSISLSGHGSSRSISLSRHGSSRSISLPSLLDDSISKLEVALERSSDLDSKKTKKAGQSKDKTNSKRSSATKNTAARDKESKQSRERTRKICTKGTTSRPGRKESESRRLSMHSSLVSLGDPMPVLKRSSTTGAASISGREKTRLNTSRTNLRSKDKSSAGTNLPTPSLRTSNNGKDDNSTRQPCKSRRRGSRRQMGSLLSSGDEGPELQRSAKAGTASATKRQDREKPRRRSSHKAMPRSKSAKSHRSIDRSMDEDASVRRNSCMAGSVREEEERRSSLLDGSQEASVLNDGCAPPANSVIGNKMRNKPKIRDMLLGQASDTEATESMSGPLFSLVNMGLEDSSGHSSRRSMTSRVGLDSSSTHSKRSSVPRTGLESHSAHSRR